MFFVAYTHHACKLTHDLSTGGTKDTDKCRLVKDLLFHISNKMRFYSSSKPVKHYARKVLAVARSASLPFLSGILVHTTLVYGQRHNL